MEPHTRKLERICAGTNFTPESEATMESAAMLARSLGASVDLVAVVERPPVYERLLTPLQSGMVDVDELTRRARERLDEVARAPYFAGLQVQGHVRVGVPFAELLTCCRQQGDDLVVVGTAARKGLNRLLLGSTAERVLRKAQVPILVAKRALANPPGVIVAPTDFSAASRPAVVEALALAKHWKARLVLTHVIEPVAHVYGWAGELAGSEIYFVEPEAIEPGWEEFLKGLDLGNITWERRTLKGDVVPTIAGIEADLIVMGTHGRSALPHALLGSVAEGVMRETEACVLTVRPDAFTFSLP
jgi:nucleotide-binding universal stress UspA family protein